MMFPQTVEYALRATLYLASLGGKPASSERIAEHTCVPAGYLSKVMRDLVVSGLVKSFRGPSGGFVLSQAPEDFTILDVVNAVAPMQRILKCPLGKPHHIKLCPLHQRLDNAIASIEKSFGETTIAEVMESTSAA